MSWALEAIEREAMRRAEEQIAHRGLDEVAAVAGLTISQVLWLRRDYMERTGMGPETIPGAVKKPRPSPPGKWGSAWAL